MSYSTSTGKWRRHLLSPGPGVGDGCLPSSAPSPRHMPGKQARDSMGTSSQHTRRRSEMSPKYHQSPLGMSRVLPITLKVEPLPPKKLTECVLGLCSKSLMLFWQHIYSQSLLTLKTDSSARRKKLFSQPNIF